MPFWQTIKQWFSKAGENANMQAALELTKITDHPKIRIDPKEYIRINENMKYYANIYPDIQYKNSYGQDKRRPFNPLNLTKTAARRLASIIFNEKCEIVLNSVDGQETDEKKLVEANEFLQFVLIDNNFFNLLELNLEKGIALGGFAMRPYIDSKGKIKISWIRADQFYPLQSNTNAISECAIATKKTITMGNKQYYYTLLEFHEWENEDYIIENELYKSENSEIIGKRVPLAEIYDDLADTVKLTGLQRPLFVYFKTPGANNKSLESPLGIGIVDNSKEILDQINLTHDQFSWEIQMGQRRVIVPAEWLRVDENDHAHPMMFDTEQNILMGMYGDSDRFGGIKDVTTAIRTVQYKDAIDHWIKEFEVQIGMSTGSMSYADDGLKTATEVVSDNSMTYQTRSSYLTMVEKALDELIHAIFELAGYKELFPNKKPLFILDDGTYQVSVHFNDGLFVDKDKQLDEDLKVSLAGMMPKKEFLKRNFGLSDESAEEWLTALKEEQQEEKTPVNQQEDALLSSGD
ncbi:phage portal protein [Melissococcus plutonius]|uniref:phage portal protein n=1 Tax=Melissococcus plutonius TaxID=33970 RepID=UPI0021E5504A|nr:phage portal protein [Melissococcus plutonius]MCV2505660.1 phage portal protein [Melissococcus plutonius]